MKVGVAEEQRQQAAGGGNGDDRAQVLSHAQAGRE
jgi:hypothetical protein